MKPYVEFQNGQKMPIVGLGTWLCPDQKEVEQAVEWALEAGYRHIDTAYLYTNEKFIGNVLKRWIDSGKVKREELFITTKLPGIGMSPDRVGHFLGKSLEALQLDYVDLYLLHSPIGVQYVSDDELNPKKDGNVLFDLTTDLEAIWRVMEQQVDAGKAKAIGVSNFDEDQLDRIAKIARIPVSNIQVELQVYLQQKVLREVCAKHKVTVCAYGPLGSPGRKDFFAKFGMPFEYNGILDDPLVLDIASKHGKSVAQVVLRFLAQEGIVVIPKSANKDRIAANIQVFDFELSEEEMGQLRSLDKGEEGRSFQFASYKGADKHPECPKFIKNILSQSQ